MNAGMIISLITYFIYVKIRMILQQFFGVSIFNKSDGS